MKNLFIILIFVLLGQISFGQTGGWFKWSNSTYVLTLSDFKEIVYDIERGVIQPGDWYNLKGGGRYISFHPKEWLDLVIQCYHNIDPNITRNSILEAVKNTETYYWDNNISEEVSNYYWNGKVSYFSGYNGAKLGVPIFIYKGKPVVKRDCGNPLGNKNQTHEASFYVAIDSFMVALDSFMTSVDSFMTSVEGLKSKKSPTSTYHYQQTVPVPVNPMINHGCTPKHYYGYNYGPNYVGPSCRPPSFIRVRISSCQPQQGQQSPRQSMGGHTAGR